MSLDWSQYTLTQLHENAIHTFREGGGSRPDVLLVEIEGHQAVLKDQNNADYLFALLIGPILTWRECKALKKLASIKCIPDLLHRPTSRSFLMSYHPSEQITHLSKITADWPSFFQKLETSINLMHAAGVAHNDLRNPTNTLITQSGDPILVDLVAAFCQGKKWNVLNQWIFNKFCQVDKSAITKLKNKCAPDLLNTDDVQTEQIAGRTGMAIRGLGQLIRKLSRVMFTNKNHEK